MHTGFSHKLYLSKQTEGILARVDRFSNKLYLEIGGKILYDAHASKVLPGFKPEAKLEMLKKLKEKAELIICISVPDIERGKKRNDWKLTYDDCVFEMYKRFEEGGIGKT
ncbi:DUF1846 family protein [Patescibacteria group bacterium]|nr:DUF1846 family protein [Patescibacteria group bacterium]MBU1256682.1 DUF1846 family protein [Patescibacteria group bacterium]MBU1457160.1 DUF1846 family protein [Patescibacteria group bacterium]